MQYNSDVRNGMVDEFMTPRRVAQAVVQNIVPMSIVETSDPVYTLDPGANTGVWGMALRERWAFMHITGVELMKMPEHPFGYDLYLDGTDFLTWKPNLSYDLIIGNPPYSDYRSGTRRTVADAWVMHSLDLLRVGGYLIYLLRHGFSHGINRYRDIYQFNPFKEVHYLLPRPNFYEEDSRVEGEGARYEYSIYLWQKGWYGTPTCHWLEWK